MVTAVAAVARDDLAVRGRCEERIKQHWGAMVRLALSVGSTLEDSQVRPDVRIVLDSSGHPLRLFLS
jgi:hypothetical protein